ncbi:MAG: double-strand break repair protein AddB, partial [Alphaproteobacteria bacterium]|nr:double-strand break repair protein AddB [Alphaproteobacteria bacterium]
TILGGMNKGISPPDPPADPWMSNAMRLDFGLPHAHWRVGLASHDAVMAMARPEVLITQSIRDQGAPTEVSRWLRRLDAVLNVAQVSWPNSSRYTAMASALNQSNTVMRPCPRPEPKPPVDLRPTQFSATQLDTLLRDPYAVYAKRILNLSALPQLEEPLSPADRGNVIHDALAGYIRAHPKALPEDQAYAALIKSGEEAFAPYRDNPQVMMFWWPRYEAIAAFFAKQEKLRALDKIMSFGEIKGQMVLDINGTPHRVTARADRIDCADAGALTIIDYKTGEPPTKAQVEQGRSLQLRVEAMLAAQGGFDDLKRAFGKDSFGIDAMVYWKVSGQRSKPVEVRDVTPEDFF